MADLTFDVVALDRASQAFIKMAGQVERLSARLDKLDGQTARITLKADDGDLTRGLDEAEAKRKRLNGKEATIKVNAKIDKSFSDATIDVNRLFSAIRSLSIPVGIAAGIAPLMQLASTAATAAQSLLLLPAAGASAAIVMGTTAVATAGLGDAFKQIFAAKGNPEKLAQAMSQLSPNMRGFAIEVARLKPQLDGLKSTVQDAFWAGFAQETADVGRVYLPVVQTGMTGVAWSMNEAMLTTSGFVKEAQTVKDVQTIFENTAFSIQALSPVGRDALMILRDIATVGSDFLPGLAGGFTECADAAAQFVHNARESGQLREWISQGLGVLGSLVQTLINVGGIVVNVFRAAHVNADGFAKDLVNISQKVKEWTASAEGQERIAQTFASLSDVSRALAVLFGAVGIALINIINNVGPALPGIAQGLADVMTWASPLTTLFGQLAGVLLGALGPALSFLAPVLGPMVALFIAGQTALRLWAVATALAGAAQTAYNVALTIGRVGQLLYAVATDSGVRQLIRFAAAQWLANSALLANPITWVVVALAALALGLIYAYNHSETFRKIVSAAWDGIKAAAGAAWDFLQAVFAAIPGVLASVGGFFVSLWTDYVVPAWNGIVGAVQVAWAAISDAASTAWATLAAIFAGIGSVIGTVGQFFMDLYTNYVQPAFDGIITAGKVLIAILFTIVVAPILILMQLMQMAFDELRQMAVDSFTAIQEEAQIWWGVISAVFNAVVGFLASVFGPIWTWLRDSTLAAFQAMQDGIAAVWNWIIANVFQPVIDFLVSIFAPLMQAFITNVTLGWQLLQGVLAGWWAVVSALWNTIIGFLAAVFFAAFASFWANVTGGWNQLMGVLQGWWSNISSLWNTIVGYIGGFFYAAFQTFWSNVTGGWNQLQGVLYGWWQWVLSNVWGPIVTYLIGPFLAGFNIMRNGVIAAWNAVRDTLMAVWQGILNNIWNPMVNFVTQTIPNAFDRGASMVGQVWTKIKQATRDPIQAVINVVYNNGIVAAWNKIAGFLNIGGLSPFNLPNYARGGLIHGGSGVRDDVPILATGGEYVLDRRTVNNMGGVDQVRAVHEAFRGDRSPLRLDPMYLLYGGDESSPGLAFGYQAGGPIAAALAFARSQAGKPYQWAGVGNPSYDCSGFQSAITNVLTGRPPNHRLFSTASFASGPVAGFQRGTGSAYVIGVVQGHPGHMAGNLAGVPVESNGRGVTVGTGRSPMSFPAQFFLPQVGGQFVNAGGGVSFDPLSWLRDMVGNLLDLPGRLAGGFPFGDMMVAYAKKAVTSVWNWLLDKVKSLFGFGGAATGTPASATAAAAAFGAPALASGGIVTRPTFGLLGESGPEVVLPLSQPARTQELARAAGYGAGGVEFHVHVTTGPNATAEDIIRTAMREARLARLSGRFAPAGRA